MEILETWMNILELWIYLYIQLIIYRDMDIEIRRYACRYCSTRWKLQVYDAAVRNKLLMDSRPYTSHKRSKRKA